MSSNNENGATESRGKMMQRHKMELKKLQNDNKRAIASICKKKDKQAKREAMENAKKLEEQLQERHNREKCELEANGEQSPASNVTEESNTPVEDAISNVMSDIPSQNAPKMSKAAKRRAKKEAEEERRRLEIEEEKANAPNARLDEERLLASQIGPLKLEVFDISPDGDCLFSSIADQLIVHKVDSESKVEHTALSLRKLAADHISAHVEEFEPFMADLDMSIREYCEKLATTKMWGGQLELRALAHALNVYINVHSVGQAIVQMTSGGDSVPILHVSYHTAAYALGEHFNSLRPIQ